MGKATGNTAPIVQMEGTTFIFVKHTNLYLVAATRGNPNVALIFEYLYQKIRILKSYLGEEFDDESVQGSFTLVYELLDETMDYGYPQNCSIDVLRLYINLGSVIHEAGAKEGAALTSQITGAIDWRREGIRYRKNEVYIDLHETVSLLTSASGVVLRTEVHGKVMMKAFLTGMPECKFGLNDKLIMEKEGTGTTAVTKSGKKITAVEIDDCTFHRCVRLGKFDSERTITFIPPDGEFELMRYRVTQSSQPFRFIPSVKEESRTKLMLNLKIHADFSDDRKATSVVIKFPVPTSTASAHIEVSRGRARYEPGERAIVWRISSMPGRSEATMSADVDLVPSTREKQWVRPPISMDFQIPMVAVSGVQVRFLKVYEKSAYQTSRWVRYLSKAGEYQQRI
jgi:AP-2 complex subunit mu-1